MFAMIYYPDLKLLTGSQAVLYDFVESRSFLFKTEVNLIAYLNILMSFHVSVWRVSIFVRKTEIGKTTDLNVVDHKRDVIQASHNGGTLHTVTYDIQPRYQYQH